MWFVIALLGAVFTSLTTIFAKIGIKDVNSDFATAYRTLVVIICSLALCLISGSIYALPQLSGANLLFLSLLGIATAIAPNCVLHFCALPQQSIAYQLLCAKTCRNLFSPLRSFVIFFIANFSQKRAVFHF